MDKQRPFVTKDMDGEIDEPKPTVEKVSKTTTIKVIKLQSLITSHLKYTGQVTGLPYEWPTAGSIVEVDERDALHLLPLRFGGAGCCGGNSTGNVVFEKVN